MYTASQSTDIDATQKLVVLFDSRNVQKASHLSMSDSKRYIISIYISRQEKRKFTLNPLSRGFSIENGDIESETKSAFRAKGHSITTSRSPVSKKVTDSVGHVMP